MARPYKTGPKEFVFGADDGSDDVRAVAADPQEAYVAFSAFFRGHTAENFTIDDEASGQRLVLRTGDGVISRIDPAKDPSVEYLPVDRPNRYTPAAMLFFENGHAGLNRFGQWVSDLATTEGSPEERGAARAATFTTESAAIDELGRIWSDSGIVDPSDRFYVFFDSRVLSEDRSERAELLVLIDFLGLERVETPADAADGEVWVQRDPRIDAEVERWA